MKKRFRQDKLFCKKRRTSEAMAIPTLPRTPKGQDKVTRPQLSITDQKMIMLELSLNLCLL